MQDETTVGEFTHQAATFGRSGVAQAAETLAELVSLAAPQPDERWLEVACGPALIARAIAPLARSVHGLDMTPAMIDVARREAAAAGLRNVTFSVGDATGLELEDGSVDGAVARFLLHHVPVPGRVVSEMARVVRPGGAIVLLDHVLDAEGDLAAWSQEVERLRDPSHWASLTPERLRALGEDAGLELETDRVFPMELDLDDWIERGSGGTAARGLVELALAGRPGGTPCFRIGERDGSRVLGLRMWLARWRRPQDGRRP